MPPAEDQFLHLFLGKGLHRVISQITMTWSLNEILMTAYFHFCVAFSACSSKNYSYKNLQSFKWYEGAKKYFGDFRLETVKIGA